MRLVSGVTTAASSFLGTTGGGSTLGGGGSLNIEQIAISGGSSIASTAGVILTYAPISSGAGTQTHVLCAGGSSKFNYLSPAGLNIQCGWFELTAPTTSADGWVGNVLVG